MECTKEYSRNGKDCRLRIADCRLRIADCGFQRRKALSIRSPKSTIEITLIRNRKSTHRLPSAIRNPKSANKKGVSMKMHRLLALVLVLAACAPVPAHASDPVGIYAVVEKVVFEPSESAPERIQIWGAFALTDGRSGDGYLRAQRGYLYFTLPDGK